jgi:hypothetical protein
MSSEGSRTHAVLVGRGHLGSGPRGYPTAYFTCLALSSDRSSKDAQIGSFHRIAEETV